MILIVASSFDKSGGDVINHLVTSAQSTLDKAGVPYHTLRVPGAVELPIVVQTYLECHDECEAAIALGCVIKGESDHYELVIRSATDGLNLAALNTGRPVVQGVLACHNAEQAIDRQELGAEFAQTAIEMTELMKAITKGCEQI